MDMIADKGPVVLGHNPRAFKLYACGIRCELRAEPFGWRLMRMISLPESLREQRYCRLSAVPLIVSAACRH